MREKVVRRMNDSMGIFVNNRTIKLERDLSAEAYNQIKTQRHQLLVKYDNLWKDAKNIDADISVLEKSSVRNDKALDVSFKSR